MVFKVIEDIKRNQANEAQSNVYTRQKALGYRIPEVFNCTSSSCNDPSVTALPLPLVVANDILDRGVIRKTSGPAKERTKTNKKSTSL